MCRRSSKISTHPAGPASAATIPDHPLPADNCHIYGADGLGNNEFAVSELHHLHPAAKAIADEVCRARGSHDRLPGPADEYRRRVSAAIRRCQTR